MLMKQIRFMLSFAVLFSCAAILAILADWIRAVPFDIDIKQRSLILLCTGLAFLFWDHFFLLRTDPDTHHEHPQFFYFTIGIVSLVFLPILFSRSQWDVVSNGLTVTGIILLLVTAFLHYAGPYRRNRIWSTIFWTGQSLLVFFLSRGLFTYLLLCAISILVGRGLLSLLGIPELYKKSLAPFATLVFWSIFLGFFVGFGTPVKYLGLLIWPLSIWLAWWGTKKKDGNLEFSLSTGDLLLVAIPLLLAFQYIRYGFFLYPAFINMDHWAYIAMGQYLWDFSRCAHEVLPPVHQFANNMVCTTRYISASLLSLISGLLNGAGDTQPGAGILLPWGMFVYTSSLRFMIEHLSTSKPIRTAYLLLGALAGWPMLLVNMSNFDNLLIISFLPVIFVVSLQTDFSWRWNIMLGLLLASVVYIYPEMIPFIYPVMGIFILKRILSIKLPISKILTALIIVGIGALAVLLPYLSTAVSFLRDQVNNVSEQQKLLPGYGYFLELISPTYQWIALWGMGGEIYDGGFYTFRTAVAVILYALLGYGCYLLIKTKEWALFVAFVIFFVSLLYVDFYHRYAYGTYKLLILFWWLIAYLVLLAFKRIADMNPQSEKKLYTAGIFGYFSYLISAAIFAFHGLYLPFNSLVSFNSIEPFKQLETLPIPPGRSIAAILTDDYNNMWAAYYLRNENVLLYPMGGYMYYHLAPFDPKIKQAAIEDIQYLLTDARGPTPPGKPIWHNSRYRLYELPDTWAYIFDINNPNTLEFKENEQLFFWLGNEPTKIQIVSNFDGCGQISFDASLGPSLPETSIRHLIVSSADETNSLVVTSGIVNDHITLRKGPENIVKLQVLDTPTHLMQPNGDTRTLLLGVSNLTVEQCP